MTEAKNAVPLPGQSAEQEAATELLESLRERDGVLEIERSSALKKMQETQPPVPEDVDQPEALTDEERERQVIVEQMFDAYDAGHQETFAHTAFELLGGGGWLPDIEDFNLFELVLDHHRTRRVESGVQLTLRDLDWVRQPREELNWLNSLRDRYDQLTPDEKSQSEAEYYTELQEVQRLIDEDQDRIDYELARLGKTRDELRMLNP